MTEEKQGGMILRLEPQAAETVRKMADKFGCDPVELVRIGLGFMNVAYEARQRRLQVAIVNDAGEALREVILPDFEEFKQHSIDKTVKDIIENAYPSSSLTRAIADLDPDNPKPKPNQGRGL